MAITARATASDAGTDHRGANFIISSQQRITGATCAGLVPSAEKGARHS